MVTALRADTDDTYAQNRGSFWLGIILLGRLLLFPWFFGMLVILGLLIR